MNNYLIETKDYLTSQNEIAKIIKDNSFEDATISIYDIEESLLENALEDLDTYSFLTEKKVIIIKNIEALDQETYKKDIDHLFNYLKSPNKDNLLIVTSKKLNNTYKFTKELKKNLKYIELVLDSKTVIKEELSKYKIDKEATDLLISYCKDDITKLKNECLKLKAFKMDEKIITKEDIKELCQEKLTDSTNLTFAFTRTLAEKNKKEALLKYQELLSYNIEPIALVGLLASQLRIMYQVKVLEENYTDNDIANILKEKPFRIQKTKELTRYYTKKELLQLIIKLQEIDLKMKTTDLNPNSLIELFILNI